MNFSRREKRFAPTGIRTPYHPVRNVVTTPTTLFQLNKLVHKEFFFFLIFPHNGFGGLEVACWPLVPEFAGSNPAEAVGLLRINKKSSARRGAWMFVCCDCFVLSGRSLCDELITRSEESYRLWCVVKCDLETS